MYFEGLFSGKKRKIRVEKDNGEFVVTIDDKPPFSADLIKTPLGYNLVLEGESHHLALVSDNSHYSVQIKGHVYDFKVLSEFKRLTERLRRQELSGSGTIVSKMPGKIVKVLANVGDEVQVGDAVLIMEAMKMENELRAPLKGLVKEIRVKEGDTVEGGQLLVVLE